MNHQDNRLHNPDQKKLEQLTHLANTLANTPDPQKTTVFLSILQEMRTNSLSFSADEQELLFTMLTENMSEAEKKKAVMIRQLSSRMIQK